MCEGKGKAAHERYGATRLVGAAHTKKKEEKEK
jgi:hypothetical protein